jgi:hypothetical protein
LSRRAQLELHPRPIATISRVSPPETTPARLSSTARGTCGKPKRNGSYAYLPSNRQTTPPSLSVTKGPASKQPRTQDRCSFLPCSVWKICSQPSPCTSSPPLPLSPLTGLHHQFSSGNVESGTLSVLWVRPALQLERAVMKRAWRIL